MKDLLKKIKSLVAKGFATKSEKEAIKKELEALDETEQEVLEDKVAEVDALPEEEEAGDEVEKMLKSLIKNSTATTKSEILSELKSEIKEWMDGQKELMEKKAGIYAKEVKDERKMANAKFKATCLALVSKDESKMKEMSTDATGTPYAGYTVDSELSAEIRHLITQYGVARREMSTIQLTKNEYKANSLVTEPTLFWVDEGSVIGSTQVVLGQESLKLKKLGAIVALTSELIDDAEVDLFAFVAGRLAEGFAKAEDLAFFTGAGDNDTTNGKFTGLLNNEDINEYVMDASSIESITVEDLNSVVDKTPSGALSGAKWYLHRSMKSILRTLKDGEGRYIYQPLSPSGFENILGYPVVEVEVFPTRTDDDEETPFMLFGDLKKACIFGYKGGIEADMFEAGSIKNVAGNADINLITTDRKAIRWIERVGYITILPGAVTRLLTGSISK